MLVCRFNLRSPVRRMPVLRLSVLVTMRFSGIVVDRHNPLVGGPTEGLVFGFDGNSSGSLFDCFVVRLGSGLLCFNRLGPDSSSDAVKSVPGKNTESALGTNLFLVFFRQLFTDDSSSRSCFLMLFLPLDLLRGDTSFLCWEPSSARECRFLLLFPCEALPEEDRVWLERLGMASPPSMFGSALTASSLSCTPKSSIILVEDPTRHNSDGRCRAVPSGRLRIIVRGLLGQTVFETICGR